MKRLFIHAAQEGISMDKLFSKVGFKKRLGLLTTAQHMNQLEIANRIIKHSVIGGQIIGCNVSAALRIRDMVDAYLFIGTGKFHPIEVALETGKDVFMANPFHSRITKLSNADVEKIRKQIKGAYIKFLAAKKIGILVSTKAGQFHPSSYLSLKEKILMAENIRKRIKKEAYIFVFDTLNYNDLNNFTDIDVWVNTACPRLIDDYKKFMRPVINIRDVTGGKGSFRIYENHDKRNNRP